MQSTGINNKSYDKQYMLNFVSIINSFYFSAQSMILRYRFDSQNLDIFSFNNKKLN